MSLTEEDDYEFRLAVGYLEALFADNCRLRVLANAPLEYALSELPHSPSHHSSFRGPQRWCAGSR